MVIPEACPACGSTRYKKNNHTRYGKQNRLCKNCERQFSAGADNLLISSERRAEIANLLREYKIPAASGGSCPCRLRVIPPTLQTR
jgi:transposase-like protein